MTFRTGEMLSKALALATNLHEGQYDKGGAPYILHPITVMQLLNSADEELNCVALLHDIVEDTHCTLLDLHELGFTTRIITAVGKLTKKAGQSYDEYKELVLSSEDTCAVKMADLTHNMDVTRLNTFTTKDSQRHFNYGMFRTECLRKLEEFGYRTETKWTQPCLK